MSTTDRVDAALAEFVRWGKHGTDREMMAAALTAADALAPPPVPEDVRRAIFEYDNAGRTTHIAGRDTDKPEDVQRTSETADAAYKRAALLSLEFVRSILATPAPTADTGDEKRVCVECIDGDQVDTLTRRVRELEEALSAERGGAETLDNEGQPDQPAPEETLDEEVARLQKEHLAGALADAIAKLQQQRDMWRDCFEEITAKAAPYGSGPPDDPERVTRYIIPAGPLHRAAGKTGVQAFGMQDRVRELEEAREQAHYANGVADLAMKHRDHAERERDEARAEAKAQSGLKLEYMAQAEAAEARLAQARADVLEEVAHLIETDFGWQLPMFDDRRLNDVTDDVACTVQEQIVCFVRGLANNSEPAAEESRKE